jgi:hypothetical protein
MTLSLTASRPSRTTIVLRSRARVLIEEPHAELGVVHDRRVGWRSAELRWSTTMASP